MKMLVLLIEYDHEGTFAGGKILGTFSEVDKVNDWCRSNISTGTNINFISTRHCQSQSIYFQEAIGIVNTDCKLTLSEAEYDPITLLGQVREALIEEETIMDLLCARDQVTDSLTSDDDSRITVVVRDIARSELYFDFNTWGISLLKSGKWFFKDTLMKPGHLCLICNRRTIIRHSHEVK